ncbi:rhomboid family intramembrane serine protease [Schleiferilactobacillus harbinensis]|uniref:rhomboid family intramembrane serine protease n=1 Tax=Schleiferilactobacillus harbinensis TaxID=304207 RepID=UPI0039E883B2
MAFERHLLKVSRATEKDLLAAERKLTGHHRSDGTTTKSVRGTLPGKQTPISTKTKGILTARIWDERMLRIEAVFVGGYFLLMIIWPPALGFLPLVLVTIGLVWLIAEILSRVLPGTAFGVWCAHSVLQSVQWFKAVPPWATLGYLGLALLAWAALALLTGKTNNFQTTSPYRLGTMVPLVGPLLFPAGRELATVAEFFFGILTLGTYSEHFLGHRRFFLIVGGTYTIIQYISVANHFQYVMLQWMILVLVGISIVGVWQGRSCPAWLQASASVIGYSWVVRSLPLDTDAQIDFVTWLSLAMILAGGIAAFAVMRKQRQLRRVALKKLPSVPWVTIGLDVVLIAFFVIEVIVSGGLDQSNMVNREALASLGLPNEIDSVGSAVRQMLIYSFLQQSIGHLVGNLIGVAIGGLVVERFFGHGRALFAILLGGFGASLIRSIVTLTCSEGVSLSFSVGIGASGMGYAILGTGLISTVFAKNIATGTKAIFYFLVFRNIPYAISAVITGGLINPTADVGDDVHVYGLLIGLVVGVFFLLWHRFVARRPLPGLNTD